MIGRYSKKLIALFLCSTFLPEGFTEADLFLRPNPSLGDLSLATICSDGVDVALVSGEALTSACKTGTFMLSDVLVPDSSMGVSEIIVTIGYYP